MKTRMLVSTLTFIFTILLINSCATMARQQTSYMLIQSAGEGDYAEVKRLIEKGADVNAQSSEGTALDYALRKGNTEIIKLLIKEGADVNAQDHRGYTALIRWSRAGHIDTVKLLIEEGADVNATTISMVWGGKTIFGYIDGETLGGCTALMAASEEGHTDIVKLLIDAGAGVNYQDEEGYTALMYASKYGHKEISKLLREAGAKY